MAKQAAIILYPNRSRLFFYAIGCAIFFYGSIYLLFIDSKSGDLGLFDLTILYTIILFFGYGLFVFIYQIIFRKPSYIIDRNGIEVRSIKDGYGFIKWGEVAAIYTTGIPTQKYMAIVLKNPNLFLDRQNFIRRFLAKINMALVGPAIFIPVSLLTPEKLNEFLVARKLKIESKLK